MGTIKAVYHYNFNEQLKWTITLNMAEQRRSVFCVVFTMSLCALESKQRSISSLFEVIWL